jgi:hypothetical protein
MKTTVCMLLLGFLIGIQSLWATTESDIAKAKKEGKVVFLVLTDKDVPNTSTALSTAQAARKIYPKSEVIQMMRSEAVNKQFVDKYKLSGAPLPMVMVIASNGVMAGGYRHDQATSENLVTLIPSPKKSLVMQALEENKSVFLIVSKKSMSKKGAVLSKCEVACTEMKDNAKVVEVDADDAAEKNFLNEMKISQIKDEPATYVINKQGQVAGSFTGITDSKTLVATATKKVSSGCCPPGSGKSCPPTKK